MIYFVLPCLPELYQCGIWPVQSSVCGRRSRRFRLVQKNTFRLEGPLWNGFQRSHSVYALQPCLRPRSTSTQKPVRMALDPAAPAPKLVVRHPQNARLSSRGPSIQWIFFRGPAVGRTCLATAVPANRVDRRSASPVGGLPLNSFGPVAGGEAWRRPGRQCCIRTAPVENVLQRPGLVCARFAMSAAAVDRRRRRRVIDHVKTRRPTLSQLRSVSSAPKFGSSIRLNPVTPAC